MTVLDLMIFFVIAFVGIGTFVLALNSTGANDHDYHER